MSLPPLFLLTCITLAIPAVACFAADPPRPATGRTREPALAGTWYPDSRAMVTALARHLERAAASAPALAERPVALVVPHAGWQYSGVAAAAAFRSLKPGDAERVVVVAPSHHAAFRGYSVDDASAYRTPLGAIPLCADGVRALLGGGLASTVAAAQDREHAVEIELPFLQTHLKGFCLVPVLVGQTTPAQEKEFAARLAGLDDGKTLFVFSSDFTHYGPRFEYTPFGASAAKARDRIRAQDDEAVGLLSKQDVSGFRGFLDRTGATICGRAGLGTMLELLARIAPGASPVLLAHYSSGDLSETAGDDSSVDYVAMAFVRGRAPDSQPLTNPPPQKAVAPGSAPVSPELGARLVRLARATLETELSGGDALDLELSRLPLGEDLERLQATFVTLNRARPEEVRSQGRLRGCVGQVEPTYPLYLAVVTAALNAALHDTRFSPVSAGELGGLEVEVTVLSPPRRVSSWKEIRIGPHGMVLEKAGRRALFLPQVAVEQHWTLEETLGALSQKAGLPQDAWREGAVFSVFEGQEFREAQAH
jgi:AmmeMemoRadiSam system protein B/AmmeMemoRadiSam system protein A